MPKDMRSFVERLERDFPGEIVRVSKRLDPATGECVSILHQLMKLGKWPMAVFEHVTTMTGQDWPGAVAFQLAGTWSKIGIGYGLPKERLNLLDIEMETAERINHRHKPVIVGEREAPVKQKVVTDGFSFFDLPGYIANEKDSGPGNVTGIIVAKDPETGRYNLSWHKDRIHEPQKIACAITGGEKHVAEILRKYKAQGKEWVPVAQVFGHHVLFGLAAAVRCGLDVDEYDFAGGILGEPLRLVPSQTWGEDFLIPADAEVVVEGYISTTQKAPSGLWVDWLRYYIPDRPVPVLKPAAINMRKDAIFEHTWVGQYVYSDIAHSAFLRTMLASRFPGVRAVNYAAPTLVIIQCKPAYPGEMRRLAGMAHAYSDFVKHVIIVDEDVDPFDLPAVLWSIGSRVDARKRAYIVEDLSPKTIDPSAEEAFNAGEGVGGLVIDSTLPVGKPFAEVGYPSKEILQKIRLEDCVSKETIDRLSSGQTTRPWASI